MGCSNKSLFPQVKLVEGEREAGDIYYPPPPPHLSEEGEGRGESNGTTPRSIL
jgi:hypothetical protein